MITKANIARVCLQAAVITGIGKVKRINVSLESVGESIGKTAACMRPVADAAKAFARGVRKGWNVKKRCYHCGVELSE